MAVYQDKAKERIKKGLRRMNGVVERAIRDDYKEADTRKIVSDVLCEYLGWDKYANSSRHSSCRRRGHELRVRLLEREPSYQPWLSPPSIKAIVSRAATWQAHLAFRGSEQRTSKPRWCRQAPSH